MFITNIRPGYKNEYRKKILYAELREKDDSIQIMATLEHILLAIIERNLDVYNFKEAFRKYIDFQEQLRISSITPTAPDPCPPCADSDKGNSERGTGG